MPNKKSAVKQIIHIDTLDLVVLQLDANPNKGQMKYMHMLCCSLVRQAPSTTRHVENYSALFIQKIYYVF